MPFTFSLLVLTTTAWLVSVWLFSNALETRLKAQLSHAASVLADRGLPLTRDVLLQFQRLLKADIVLVGRQGGLGLSTLTAEQADLERTALEQYANWRHLELSQDKAKLSLQVVRNFYTLAFHSIPEERDPRYAAVVVIGSLADIRDAARDAAWTTGGLALLGTLLFAWIVHRIASTITRPIAELASMAGRIADGDRAIRAPAVRDDEIGGLALALNKMAEEIGSYEQKLAQNSRLSALGQMSARIAHEVRNPLTAIKLHLQILGETLDSEQAGIVKTLLDEVLRLELIVSGILELGRPISLDLAATDLNSLVKEIVQLFEAQLQHRRIHLETSLVDGLPELWLDKARIKQVLLNLLTNACDELPGGGHIAISTRFDPASKQGLLMVEDSGPGLRQEAMEQIFAPHLSAKSKGFGLGLSLSKELVELHQGCIEAGSSPLGGACFTVYLPAEERDSRHG